MLNVAGRMLRAIVGAISVGGILFPPASAWAQPRPVQTPARPAPAQSSAPAPPAVTTARGTGSDLSSALEAATALVAPSVVKIVTTSYTPAPGVVPNSADLVSTERGSGSGVIVDPDGYIITNAHVVHGAQRLRVELAAAPNGQSILATRSRTVGAQVVGIDLETDLAVLKVMERGLQALSIGDSDELRSGQLVVAVGSPLGLYNSVSIGVVSAIARQLTPESPMIYVQTDASINPGSSGGPLVDLRGRLMGINTMITTQSGGNEGLGFAVPSNIVSNVFEQIRKNGRVRRGDIGLFPQTITPIMAAGLQLPRATGVILADVRPNSAAARAGVRPGDLVLSVDGKPMENGRQLQITLYRKLVGDVVTLEIMRGGQTTKVPIAMDERPDPMNGLSELADPRQNLVPRLGILAVPLNEQIARQLSVVRVRSGVVVASTTAGAIDSAEGGLAPGDVIYAVNGKAVASLADLRTTLDGLKAGDPVVLQLERRTALLYLTFTAE